MGKVCKYRQFSWRNFSAEAYHKASEFATQIGPENLISISGNESFVTHLSGNSGHITVWYWEEMAETPIENTAS